MCTRKFVKMQSQNNCRVDRVKKIRTMEPRVQLISFDYLPNSSKENF